MKNASKILIITLIILILVIGLIVIKSSKPKTNSSTAKENEFNKIFLKYKGEIIGSMVVELLDNVIVNVSENKDYDEKLPDVIYVNTENNEENIITSNSLDSNLNALGALRTSLNEKHYYKVDFHNNATTKLIDYIIIKY